MKCDIQKQNNAHPQNQSQTLMVCGDLVLNITKIFVKKKQERNVYELQVYGKRKTLYHTNQSRIPCNVFTR